MEEKELSANNLFTTISASSLLNDTNLFTTESLVSMLDDYYNETSKLTTPTSNDVTWELPEFVYDTSKSTLLDSNNVSRTRTSQLTKLFLLESKLNELKVTLSTSSSSPINWYLKDIIGMRVNLQYNNTHVLSKEGMRHCNDIYTWYEGVK
jgi:hypothetical protein